MELPRGCSDCRGCQKCSFRGQQYTEQETMEYKAIEPGIWFENEDELVTVEQTEEVANESPIATFGDHIV